MKRKLALFLTAILLLSLCGCRGTTQTSSASGPERITAEQMEEKLGMPVVHVVLDLPNEDEGWKAGQLEDTFFTFPERAMKNRLLLPLDGYIEKVEYMDWDRLLPVIMEAGRNGEGQQIIPLSFSFEALYVDMEKYGLEDFDRSMTLPEMRQSDNPALQYAASQSVPKLVGRVTASINEFAAINRNARHPELAFKIIDYLMSMRVQQDSSFFHSRVPLGMPVHMDLGSEEYPLRDKRWYMSGENFEEYRAARDEITEAKFTGPADKALWDIDTLDPKNLEKSVHEQYTLIRMLLAES